jgi:hypothetical protein
MAYSLEEEDNMLSLFESIANQPIEQQRPYNEVRNPKPMMESAIFEGTKVDFSSWTTDSKKVGKAKTASNPDLSKGSKAAKGTTVATKGTKDQVTENDVVTMKKEDKQVTKLVTEDASHEAKGEPKAKSGSFDSAAKSTASAQRSKAESNKKFSEESKRQRKIDMFRDFVKSLGVDEKSKADAEKVLKKFDQISKHIVEADSKRNKSMTEATTIGAGARFESISDATLDRLANSDPNNIATAIHLMMVAGKKKSLDKRISNGEATPEEVQEAKKIERAFSDVRAIVGDDLWNDLMKVMNSPSGDGKVKPKMESIATIRPWSCGGMFNEPTPDELKWIEEVAAKKKAGEPLDKFEQYVYDRAEQEGRLPAPSV